MNTYEIISQSLYDQLLTKRAAIRGGVFAKTVIPINKIDGIHNIQCNIIINTLNFKDYQLEMLIETRGDVIFTKRTGFFRGKHRIHMRIKEFQDTIKQLRVSPKGDKLTAHYEMERVIWAANVEFCSGLGENVGKSYDECCVCGDNTIFTTSCKHHLCIRCVSRLVKPKCPMCRGAIYEEDDDDDDDADDDDDDLTDDDDADADNADNADNASEADPRELVSDLDSVEPASDSRMGVSDFSYLT